jgi:succinyl-diaminopimelate desuccinylase
MNAVIDLASALIRIPSITPYDKGCQALLIERLTALGFSIVPLPYQESHNFWAYYGEAKPSLVFAGHTDVVPVGDENAWKFPPFEPTLHEGHLYGRGAADMKGALACMIVAVEKFIQAHPHFKGGIGFLITSAEEGPSHEGTPIVLDYLKENDISIDYCIVGEPTSEIHLGDVIKNGRRGSLTGRLIIQGKQGHIAYPHLADNPIHRAIPVLNELLNHPWDEGNAHFQPTSFQISNIHAGTGAGNVIPADITIDFNLRYSPEITADKIQSIITSLLQRHALNYTLDFIHYGEPYYTDNHAFLAQCQKTIFAAIQNMPRLSTSGGTSDARYIAKYCKNIIELGLSNASIHQVNEQVRVDDLINLTNIYYFFMRDFLTR